MRQHVRLGRVAGVDVGINWSVLAIFLLVTLGLATGRFPAVFPDQPPLAYWLASLAAGIVFFLSLLAHEISHAVVAQRNGLTVEGITLWLFGGVANLKGEPPSPGADLRIAGVGPLVSLLLAGAFYAAGMVVAAVGASGLLVAALVWLGVINLMLAIFNLMPAAPLDGGRILRALLWRRRGDRTSAAITAARAGRAFGWFLVALGFVQILYVGFGGLWLMLIGWFLTSAATAEEQHAKVSSALAEVRVADVMTRDPTTVPASTSVDRFLEDYVLRNRHSTFPLTADGARPVGLVTLRRVKAVAPGERATTTVDQVACPLDDLPVAHPDDPLAELLPGMAGCSDGRALVVDEGRLVGIVSPADVMHQLEIAALRSPRQQERV